VPRPRHGARHRDLRRFLLQRLGTGVVLLIGITLVAWAIVLFPMALLFADDDAK